MGRSLAQVAGTSIPVREVGILGVGTVGSSLALYLPQRGYLVTIWTRRDARAVRQDLGEVVHALIGRELLLPEAGRCIEERLSVTGELGQACRGDVIVEAVAEDIAAKREMLARASALASAEALIATTTSSLGVSDLASSVARPERFLALHFFVPVARMPLVEVAPHAGTGPRHLERALAFVRSLDRTPLLVKDVPGFIVNRLVLAECNRAAALIEQGIADVDEIDLALRLGASRPVGPLELGDNIGWDVVLAALENLFQATRDEAFRPCPLIRCLLDQGRRGRKAGEGFYLYDGPHGRKLRAHPTHQGQQRMAG
jgi:3-hydroxybutyryl-CoA dehydrogenase